ncbi:hypothetical protein DICPUDRAFT_74100 [Dictyostelium purpureum]|uniref:N-acetyltransferase domain-containing protein n=1 Tax=Dictyostelium purpureum TaxID=5786 RepID=F0Z6M4_DICPU|nr:uncharacterized protein DICPUDRAFT_74100 [Dictyostelium purpureum]EGC40336.1 hypothetical protein DICPUDRAFT_74100 [Dictyostelium purpureum]|eukprot:XP_003283087.1 hypothetical protein DICPUDRAFT_74100 [Dictyostelium purpureum]
MNNIDLKKITVDDLKELQIIGKKTFYETFKDGNTEADMVKYLQEGFEDQKLIKEIQNENSEFYFAIDRESDNAVVGYLKLNIGQAQTEIKENNSFEIERIYVIQEYHGKKVGQVLFNKALEIAINNNNIEYIWLGVWEGNPRAIQFYKKNGFIEFDKHIFVLGNDEQIDIMMKLVLKR